MNTTYFLNLVAGNIMKTKTTPAIPGKMYLGLSRTAPTLEGRNVSEPATSAGYARVELTNLSEPAKGVVTNQTSIDFNESTAEWGIVTHFVIFDAESGGNLLMYGELSTSRSVETATIMTIKAGSLNLSVLNPTATA